MKTQRFVIDITMPKCDFATESFITDLLKSEFSEDVYEGRWKVKVEEVKYEESPTGGISLPIPENTIQVRANIQGNNYFAGAVFNDLSVTGILHKIERMFGIFRRHLSVSLLRGK